MFDFLWLHGLEPTRLLCPWNFPGKNSGMSCHFLLQWFISITHTHIYTHIYTDIVIIQVYKRNTFYLGENILNLKCISNMKMLIDEDKLCISSSVCSSLVVICLLGINHLGVWLSPSSHQHFSCLL